MSDPFEPKAVYVSPIPLTFVFSDISEIFAQCGKVEKIHFCKPPPGMAKENRCFIFVYFSTEEGKKLAIELDEKISIQGISLKIKPAKRLIPL